MDFDQAIQAHVEWKTKLRHYLTKRDASLTPVVVSKDNACALGKWIYEQGKRFDSIPEFLSLKAEHARFHIYTAQIVEMVNSGEIKEAEEMMKAGSEFMRLSTACVNLILQVKNKAVK